MNVEYVKLNGKQVGEVINSLAYVSHRRKSKHLHRASDSWGVDKALLDILQGRNIDLIAIHDIEGKKAYYTSMAEFNKESFFLDFGHNLQRFLERDKWHKAPYKKFLDGIVNLTNRKEAS